MSCSARVPIETSGVTVGVVAGREREVEVERPVVVETRVMELLSWMMTSGRVVERLRCSLRVSDLLSSRRGCSTTFSTIKK